MTKANMFFVLGFSFLIPFAPSLGRAQGVQQPPKTVKMNWSTLICFQDSAASDKMFYVRGDDGIVYSMSSREWDCGKYSRLFAIPANQCDCVLKSTQVAVTETAPQGEQIIAAGAVKVEPIATSQAPASQPVASNIDEQKQREVRSEVMEIGKQAAEQGREVTKEINEIQNPDRGGVIVDDSRRDDRQNVRDERRDDRQVQRDTRVDERRDVRDERRDDRRGL